MLKTYNDPGNQSKTLHFLHGNSITPQSYSKLLNSFSDSFLVKYFLLRPLWYKEKMPNFKNWNIFLDDYLDSIKNEDNIIGIGHSIGGNLLLKAALKKPEKFTKIILLDPTFLIPYKIRIWNIFSFFNLQSIFLPLIKSAKKGSYIIDMTTGEPETTRRISKILKDLISKRVKQIDQNEENLLIKKFKERIKDWENLEHDFWTKESSEVDIGLIHQAGDYLSPDFYNRTWITPTSMRDVDTESNVVISHHYNSSNNLVEE